MDCPVLRRQVDAPGKLTLTDNDGTEVFQLTAAEYARVVDLVREPAFDRALEDPSDCHPVPDAGGVVELIRKNGGGRDAIASCVDGRTASDHIYNRLMWLLIDLQKEHLDCFYMSGRRICDVCRIEPC